MSDDKTHEFGASVRYGNVSEMGTDGRVRVTLDDGGITTAPLSMPASNTLENKSWFPMDVGEHVAVLLDEHGESGYVLGAAYSDADSPPVTDPDKTHFSWSDGAWVEYDRKAHSMQISVPGNVAVTTTDGGTLTASVDGDVSISSNGKLTASVQGDLTLTAGGNMSLKATGSITINGATVALNP
jgi:phage baseplate assembly protein V